ncbi:c-type cytochrome biogenesis protein CcmI [bacterium]|jgi:cytochrome c-type biogenesis protein CcmH|nr:c-type cytochrome biogenesis protein CcmI [Gammaproteobacteria bacterium]MBT6026361.1 c-type cytochrome biogenesis protein CcmI [Gammaproteobacteria bacterium]MDA9999282.1 c-type cytochrome biogenesis protein CcmI [bacterium]
MLGFVILAALGLAFLVLPIFMQRGGQGFDARGDSTSRWYRSRLAELEDDAADPEVREEIKAELGAVLLAEMPADSEALDTTQAAGQLANSYSGEDAHALGRKFLTIASLLLVALSTLVYSNLGDYRLPEIRGAEAVLELSMETNEADILSWQGRLENWLADNADDAKSWYLLGHSHLKQSNFSQAAQAFANTNALVENDISVKFYWLQSRYMANKGVLDATSKSLAEEILKVDPTNDSVLEILAIAAISEGESATAIRLLNQSLSGLRDARRQVATIQAIGTLRETLSPAPQGISVEVSASAEVAAQVDKTATIFVVARPIGGGMPYAAVRRPAALMPFSVRIDDLVSMSDTRKLSSAEDFEIMVRLSVSGVAQAEKGDWVWRSQPFSGNEASIGVVQAILAPATGSD